jgi:hypothetical protein
MSGAANQGAYGNPGMGQGPWGGAGGWRSPGGNQPSDGGNRQGGPAWPNDYFAMWSFSRPLLIAATITGFIIWWPVGLALLFVSIWNKRVGRFVFGRDRVGGGACGWGAPWTGRKGDTRMNGTSSGNQAFDEYKAETLRRLEEEQGEFAHFLERLRFAKDKAEFDQFMAERRQRPTPSEPQRPTEG